MLAPSAQIWGYDTNYGSFGQFSRVQAHQVMPKAEHLTWEEAAAPTLVGTTAYRMLFGWAAQHGAGRRRRPGLGRLGRPRHAGDPAGRARRRDPGGGRVGRRARASTPRSCGAVGWINRKDFDHWGIPPRVDDAAGQKAWSASARAFGKKLSEILGRTPRPGHRVRAPRPGHHPDQHLPLLDGRDGGDLRRHHRLRRRRRPPLPLDPPEAAPGFARHQRRAGPRLQRARAARGRSTPASARSGPSPEIAAAHEAMARGEEVFGNTVCLVGAPEPGQGRQ